MRIAQVCPRYPPYIGGVETHVQELSERLVRRGFEVAVLTTDSGRGLAKSETLNGVKVRRFWAWAPGEAYYFSGSLRYFLAAHASDFDVVHAHCYHAFPALYAAQAMGSNRLVFTSHYHGVGHTWFRSLLHVPYRFIGRRIFDTADRVICVSEHERSLVERNFGLDDEKLILIPNGLDLHEFSGLQRHAKERRLILTVGRLEKYKGVQYLIRVLPYLMDDFVVEVVGRGPYREHLVELSRKLGVADRVRFLHGLSRAELLQEFADADVFALLSEHEAYGITVAEALCAGTPCVVARTSALAEWIDGKGCFGIDLPIDYNRLANVIESVVGLRVAKPNVLDWDDVVRRLVGLYESL